MQIIFFNFTYVVYPIIIGFCLAFTKDDLHDNWSWAVVATVIPTTIEIFQVFSDPFDYFGSISNLLDCVGLLSILTFLFIESHGNEMLVNLIVGLFCIFYRGIMSLSIIHDKFMISIKLIKNSIMDMIPFGVILGTQIMLFATLNSIK